MNATGFDLVDKVRAAIEEMKALGEYSVLFGLFEREDNPGMWDVVVSGDWVEVGRATIDHVVSVLERHLSKDDWLNIAAIVPIEKSADFVRIAVKIYESLSREQGAVVEFPGGQINGIQINHAFIVEADPDPFTPMRAVS